MRRDLSDLRVIVTGASSGIGRALVVQLLAMGAKVVAVARRADRLEALVRESPASPERLRTVVGDVTDRAIRQSAIAACVTAWGGVDALVNNAGIGALGSFASADDARLRRIMEVNFFAPAQFIREALPELRQGRQPLVVNIGSVLGHRAVPGKSEYCASKFALHGFTDALRAELGREGIGVLLISPSTTQSEFFDAALVNGKAPKRQQGAMSPAAVARQTIKAMQTGRAEIILSAGGKLLVWLDRLCPPLANWLVAKYG